jgi:hypothetical protein
MPTKLRKRDAQSDRERKIKRGEAEAARENNPEKTWSADENEGPRVLVNDRNDEVTESEYEREIDRLDAAVRSER